MIKGVTLILGGTPYEVPPLSLGALEDFQERLARYNGGRDAESIKTVVDVVTAALKRNYPDITREEVRDIIGLENMVDVMGAVMNVSGMVKQEEGAPGEVEPGNP